MTLDRRLAGVIGTGIAAVLGFTTNTALAYPAFGVSAEANCFFCHGDKFATDRYESFNFDGFVDPQGGVGELPFYSVAPGDAATLSFRALDGEEDYAFQLKGVDDADVSNGNALIYLGDGDWDEFLSDAPTYYTASNSEFEGYHWNTSDPTEVDFDLAVNPATEPGYYLLTMALAGRDPQRLGWYQEQQVYLEVLDDPNRIELTASDLVRGQAAQLIATNAAPNSNVYFVYSSAGYGNTDVPQLGVTLGISSPTLGGSSRSNGAGQASLAVTVPPNAPRINIWIQAAQAGNVSNVVATRIQ